MGALGDVIVDTDVLIDHLRDKDSAEDLLEDYVEEGISTTDINSFELFVGAYRSDNPSRRVSSLKGFLNSLKVYSTSEDSMEVSGRIMAELQEKGETVGPKDVLIAGIAMVENRPVLTYNSSHFSRIDGLEVLSPPED